MKCDLCGKSVQYGMNVSHSKRHTNRVFNPNIHAATITIGEERKRVNLCTRCLRTYNKAK